MEKLNQAQIELWLELEEDEFYIDKFRGKHDIDPSSDTFHKAIGRLCEKKRLKRLGRGLYRKIKLIKPVQVYGRERRPPIMFLFPKDFDTGEEMCFARDIILREGDLILLSGASNYGKTTLCMNIAGENIKGKPVLMGNEYTTIDDAPSPRFLNRLDAMDWVEWADSEGKDRFTLLPVRRDYAEHVVRDKINIIDWINLDGSQLYNINLVMEDIKRAIGKGIGVIAIQKAPGAETGRGGQFTKDFADCELLLDKFGATEVMLTIGKVKESSSPVVGRTFAYSIARGVRITDFREIVKCFSCFGKGWRKFGNANKPCDDCNKTGYINK